MNRLCNSEMAVIFIFLFGWTSAFVPKIQMPYHAILGNSSQITAIGTTLTCNESRMSIRDCAMECYARELNGSECPGFYRESFQGGGGYYICHPSSLVGVQASIHTAFNSSHTLYLLKLKSAVPTISVNFDNYTDTHIYGKGTTGTKSGVSDSDHIDGIKNKALYLHGGEKVSLTGLEGECWTNLDHCSSGVTMSIWFKPLQIKISYPVSTGGILQTGLSFVLQLTGKIALMVTLQNFRYDTTSVTQLSTNQWFLLTGAYHRTEDTRMYINGILEKEVTPFAEVSLSTNQINWGAMLGIRDSNPEDWPINGYIDEFKYFYRVLSTTEIWREFVGYNIDLEPTYLILPPYGVNDTLDYSVVTNGDNQTCVDVTADGFCGLGPKMKLLNTAPNIDSFSVVVYTSGLGYHHKDLHVYGHQDLGENQGRMLNNNNLHFTGKFSNFELVDLEIMNGIYRCIFKPLLSGFSLYVFVEVKQIHETETRKICEVDFT